MDSSQARQILQALLDGKDPITRKPLPEDSPVLQNPVYIALDHAIMCLKADASNSPENPPARRFPIRPSQRGSAKWTDWSQDEQRQLVELFDAGVTLPELAKMLRRSEDAVRGRLIGLGRFRILIARRWIAASRKINATPSTPTPPALRRWKKDRPQAGKPWTPEERARLRDLASTGMSEAEMGRHLGRGELSIGVQLVKLGIRMR